MLLVAAVLAATPPHVAPLAVVETKRARPIFPRARRLDDVGQILPVLLLDAALSRLCCQPTSMLMLTPADAAPTEETDE